MNVSFWPYDSLGKNNAQNNQEKIKNLRWLMSSSLKFKTSFIFFYEPKIHFMVGLLHDNISINKNGLNITCHINIAI